MSNKTKVLLGMSGGIDSSVAALLLKEQGYEVIGATMSIWDGEYYHSDIHACYGPNEKEEIDEAKSICDFLNIPFHVFDCSADYKKFIIEYFRKEYLSGRTPNPCIKCNQVIKFGILPKLAEKSGINYDYFATGHYANVEFDSKSNRYLLKKGKDLKKDQSYFLYRLSQSQLSKILFPLGQYFKEEIKEIAKNKLFINDKKESQNFYTGSYKELLRVEDNNGNIIDKQGNIIGIHSGIWNYTIGQRKKIDANCKKPLYVVEINKENNTIIVGDKVDLQNKSFLITDTNWIGIENINSILNLNVKIRSSQQEKEAIIQTYNKDFVKITFCEPVEAITLGQSAVLYSKDNVIGGGIISKVID